MLKINNETPSERIKKNHQKKPPKTNKQKKEVEKKKENTRKLENLSRKSHIQKEDFQNKRAEMAEVKKLTEIIQENSHGLKGTCFEGKDSPGAQQS